VEDIFGKKGLLAKTINHFEFRPEQLKMAQALEKALKEEHYLIAEAGTGTGKTLAYLIPSILSGKKVVISTATKNLQEQLYYKDIPLLQKILPFKFRAAYMKGRSNYLCLHRFNRFKSQPTFQFKTEISHFEDICHWVHTTATGDCSELENIPDDYTTWGEICSDANLCLGQKCSYFKECFITLLKQKAQRADIIIVNHHLFFADLMLKVTGYGEVIPNHDVIVFDESHQIEEIATNYLGFTISNYRLDELIRDTLRELKLAKYDIKPFNSLLENLERLYPAFFQSFTPLERKPLNLLPTKKSNTFGQDSEPRPNALMEFTSSQPRYRLRQEYLTPELITLSASLLNSLTAISSTLANLSPKTEAIEALIRRAQEIGQQLTFVLEMKDPAYVYWCETKGKGVFLKASPIEVGEMLHRHLFEQKDSIIFTSATLSTNQNFSYLKERLGLTGRENIEELILDSHFDYKKQAILYLPKYLPEPGCETFGSMAAEEIEHILELTSGRAFVLFTSYKNMLNVYEHLKGRLQFTLLLQGEKPKSTLLKQFKDDIHSVLFATNSFWEGVDVQGEALSCVIIDKLPFDPPTEPIVEARIEYITSQGDNAFFSYQIPSAIISLKQGLGRLIRNRDDHGVLSILDKRLHTRSYRRLFLNSLPPCPTTSNLPDINKIFTNNP
jgi:ATP-dependent DNA helicase DinG